ncbi:hypothetical protein DPMN_113673 [Dreissena polymorpha]|uniref:Uncharacterized protein n=1 Tax=Dreissena polymorpha TaxID=45954 RepID=A0A9D4QQW2_DREPO|nr:hypothetical protein DPMN_113673 [Dreissena polymorpha]
MRTTPKNGKKKVVYKKKVEHMSRSCPICSLQGITTLYARVSDYIWRKHKLSAEQAKQLSSEQRAATCR